MNYAWCSALRQHHGQLSIGELYRRIGHPRRTPISIIITEWGLHDDLHDHVPFKDLNASWPIRALTLD
jgi:hypothetical protein